jgi:hypothetical protein
MYNSLEKKTAHILYKKVSKYIHKQMRITTKIDGKICKKTAVNIYTNAVVAYRILWSSTQRKTAEICITS